MPRVRRRLLFEHKEMANVGDIPWVNLMCAHAGIFSPKMGFIQPIPSAMPRDGLGEGAASASFLLLQANGHREERRLYFVAFPLYSSRFCRTGFKTPRQPFPAGFALSSQCKDAGLTLFSPEQNRWLKPLATRHEQQRLMG